MSKTNNQKVARLKKLKKIFLVLTVSLISLIILSLFIRVTYVYDLKTKLPIANAQVLVTHNKFWVGCVNDKYYKTNFLGIIFDVGLNNSCTTLVEKDGYIKNGKNNKSGLINKIYLQKSTSTALIYYTELVFEKDGIDFLGALRTPLILLKKPDSVFELNRIKPVFSELVNDTNVDVVIESIEDTEKRPNYHGYKTAKVKFLGAGGIREISDKILSSSADKPFASLNLITPPKEEYAKEMIIDSYKQYVVRLRDGETYIKIIPSINKESLTFEVITFDDLLLPRDKNQEDVRVVAREIKIYPSDGKILDNKDISLSGQGFVPYSQISFYIEETDTRWSRNVEADGSWNTYFGEIIGEGSYNTYFTTAETRTLFVSENNNQEKFVFSIDKNSKSRQIYFLGLALNLPANLFIDSRDLNWIKLTDGNNKNSYSIYSKEQTYNDFRLSIRPVIIQDLSLPAGIFRISIPGKSDADIYSFYDYELKRSFELIGRGESEAGLNLGYLLSLISNAQIQK